MFRLRSHCQLSEPNWCTLGAAFIIRWIQWCQSVRVFLCPSVSAILVIKLGHCIRTCKQISKNKMGNTQQWRNWDQGWMQCRGERINYKQTKNIQSIYIILFIPSNQIVFYKLNRKEDFSLHFVVMLFLSEVKTPTMKCIPITSRSKTSTIIQFPSPSSHWMIPREYVK